MKYYYKNLMGLEILRRGSFIDRLMAFYEVYGSNSPDARITVWTPDEVATVIGLTDGDGKPKGKNLSAIRAKAVRLGLLEKVSARGMYSYRVVSNGGLPDDALDILNKKGRPDITYCRRQQIPRLMASEKLEDLPNIYLWSLNDRTAVWWYDLPELIDFEEADCWEFWTTKAINAVSGKGHPLKGIEDPDLRLQVALTGLEMGLERNLKKNPDWYPGDPIAWTLHALKGLVGIERDWGVLNTDNVSRLREGAKQDGTRTLTSVVEASLSAPEENDVQPALDKDADGTSDNPQPEISEPSVEESYKNMMYGIEKDMEAVYDLMTD